MDVKSGHKKTDVGVVPDDWTIRSLGEIGESLIGLTYRPADVRPYGTLVLRSSNIQEGVLNFDDNVFVCADVPDKIIVKTGDILICVRNGSRNLIGKCVQIDERAKGMTFGAFMAVFRTPLHMFVCHQLKSDIVKKQVHEHLGATINQITNKSLNSFRIPLPPTRAEQEKIAEALSDADVLIESLEQLLAKKRHIKQGAMEELLTGKTRLPGFDRTGITSTDIGIMPSDWRALPIGRIAQIKTGPFGSTLHERDYVEHGTPIITVEHLDERGIIHKNLPKVSDTDRKRLGAYSLQEGDIVFSRVGSIDRNARVSDPEAGWLFSGRLLRLRASSDVVNTSFLSYQFHSKPFKERVKRLAVGQTMASLNTRILNCILAALPPLDEQAAIAAVLSDIDAEMAVLEAELAKSRSLKQGMMQVLLTGRIRLL